MIGGLLRTMRPHQVVKNLFVLAPLVFAQELDQLDKVLGALGGFVSFSLLTSSVYILNDLVDLEADRAHPVKKNRPIASGRVSPGVAKVALVILVIAAFTSAWFIGVWFLACLLGYLVNNIAYSFGLKRVAYLDVVSIALGFELRVVAGSFAAEVPPSAYLLTAMFMLAMFLGFGKRMHELIQQEAAGGSVKSRKVLRHYNVKIVRGLLWGFGIAACVVYVVYTLDPEMQEAFGTDLLVFSSVFVFVAVLRFAYLIGARPDAESPTEEMLKDPPFIATLVLWAVAVIAIIYVG